MSPFNAGPTRPGPSYGCRMFFGNRVLLMMLAVFLIVEFLKAFVDPILFVHFKKTLKKSGKAIRRRLSARKPRRKNDKNNKDSSGQDPSGDSQC